MNEATDFFAANPLSIAAHAKRRIREAGQATVERLASWSWSLLYRAGQRVRDVARLAGSRAIQTGQLIRDFFRLGYSFAYRTSQHVRDCFGLAYSFVYRCSQRVRDRLVIRRVATRDKLASFVNLISEISLTGLAACARLTPDLARSMVSGMHDRRPLRSGNPCLPGSFVEIAVSGRAWHRSKVLDQLERSNADFVVFRHNGESGDAYALTSTALQTDAFAAAKQVAHSAWRPSVVRKHPFRCLQEGEVTEVASPYSGLIAIRRETLLALGCPHAFTWGAALMLIFWKASAAGMKSIVVGYSAPVPDEPAMVLEDLELAVRLKLSPKMAKMGPARPHQLRGNVATSPWHRRALRGKLRVLVVSPYLPFPLSHGGAVRIYNLCREMAGEIDFTLLCFREANETVCYDELHEVFREVHVVDADEKHADPELPAQVLEYRNTAMAGLIRRFCLEGRVDIVQLEYTQLAEYSRYTGSVPVVLVEHDITFTLHRQMADLSRDISAQREYLRWLEFERAALQCCNVVWTMSGFDRATALEFGAPAARTTVVQNGVDLGRYEPLPKTRPGRSILFVGSFRHRPNLLAFEALRDTIMPEVWRNCPDAVLHVIAGPRHEDFLGPSILDARIILEGFVSDVRPAYRDADLVAIPLPVSAGTNIKLMEAMACGRAVVSTPAGCRGLHLFEGRELIVADLGPGFSDAIVALLDDEVLRMKIAGEARITAEDRFGWDSIARTALESYAALSTGHAASAAFTSAQ
jgi:glycosyltransferase involved in cell wall biosynthesis